MSHPPFKTHALLNHKGITHGFFGRQGGVSKNQYKSLNAGEGSHDDAANVDENRARIAAALGAKPDHLLSNHQIHSREVLILDAPFTDRPKADGMVTKTPGIALSALSADCGPVLFADPKAKVIGACHAGWRGALSGVTDATVDAMEALGAARENIHAVLGPCIGPQSYEVGAEFRDEFVAVNEIYDRFFELGLPKENGERRPHFDLKRFLLHRLRRAGLSHIEALPDCTYALPDHYYSYRYNTHQKISDYGRNISAIMLQE
ncbi:MAG: peptidoglycan editing factor PgeF [Maricaulaceae bacterium]